MKDRKKGKVDSTDASLLTLTLTLTKHRNQRCRTTGRWTLLEVLDLTNIFYMINVVWHPARGATCFLWELHTEAQCEAQNVLQHFAYTTKQRHGCFCDFVRVPLNLYLIRQLESDGSEKTHRLDSAFRVINEQNTQTKCPERKYSDVCFYYKPKKFKNPPSEFKFLSLTELKQLKSPC